MGVGGKYEYPVDGMTDRSSARFPQVHTSSFFTGQAGSRGCVSAAKDTEVSAMRLGNIVHQAASVMGSSLWQWSSGHKSKRAHKHRMTDGWEDSSGQGGRDGELQIKWERRTEEEERSQAGSVSCMKTQPLVYESSCSVSAVKRERASQRKDFRTTLYPANGLNSTTIQLHRQGSCAHFCFSCIALWQWSLPALITCRYRKAHKELTILWRPFGSS